MRNLRLTIEYDGTDFKGWQRQPGQRTVEEVLVEAVGSVTGVRSNCTASGRTDAGVHALGQVVQLYSTTQLSAETFVKALNALLPPDVRVLDAADMPQAWHPTIDARSKRYRYVIDNRRIARPLLRRTSWHIKHPLDEETMRRGAQALVGRFDFRSFETEWPNRTSSVRTIFAVDVVRDGDTVMIEVEADGFLYNMVRAIAGSLVWVGTGRRSEGWMAEVVAAEDRRAAGPNAPPQGLFLLYVRY